ncbi:MAG: hypothetical protein R3296_07165 [Oleiphilaceae bacterium]|nr:hypothetical protein [Oleiphilaceae bacterium]
MIPTDKALYRAGTVRLPYAQQGAVHPALLGFMAAVLLTTLTGTLVQTQFNLAAVQALGAGIGPGTWLWVTLQDLAGFSPVLFVITLMTFLVAIPASALFCRLTGLPRYLVYTVGTATGLVVAMRLVDHQVPMPTLIAASRGLFGTVALMACAAAGGWIFAAMTSDTRRRAR